MFLWTDYAASPMPPPHVQQKRLQYHMGRGVTKSDYILNPVLDINANASNVEPN